MTLRAHTTSSAALATASVVVVPSFVSAIGGLGLSVDGACMQRIQTIVEKPV